MKAVHASMAVDARMRVVPQGQDNVDVPCGHLCVQLQLLQVVEGWPGISDLRELVCFPGK